MSDFPGLVRITDPAQRPTVELDGNTGDVRLGGNGQSGSVSVRSGDGNTTSFLREATLELGGSGQSGSVNVRTADGNTTTFLREATLELGQGPVLAAQGQAGRINLKDAHGQPTVQITGGNGNITLGGQGVNGDVVVRRSNSTPTIHLNGQTGGVFCHDANGNPTVVVDGASGDVKLRGSDCAEDFEIATDNVEPGTVMSIDVDGRLRPSRDAYDKTVAGIVSGAGAYRPGIILGRNSSSSCCVPIALTGRAFCKVDASSGPVAVGDLLTTSPRPGYAMSVVDPSRAHGAVLGKALQPLESGTGLIPVLVALQ
jgi:hypothetical protein